MELKRFIYGAHTADVGIVMKKLFNICRIENVLVTAMWEEKMIELLLRRMIVLVGKISHEIEIYY
jgi:hypothetical protein